jgi:hypothetical protein
MPIFDGNIVDLQDLDGVVGTTSGNVMFVAKSEEPTRSRPLRITEQGLAVDQSNIHRVLNTILNQIRDIERGIA